MGGASRRRRRYLLLLSIFGRVLLGFDLFLGPFRNFSLSLPAEDQLCIAISDYNRAQISLESLRFTAYGSLSSALYSFCVRYRVRRESQFTSRVFVTTFFKFPRLILHVKPFRREMRASLRSSPVMIFITTAGVLWVHLINSLQQI